jgi:hypothetical protein
MKRTRVLAVSAIALAALCLVAYPVYAQVAGSVTTAKEMLKTLDQNKMTLVKAISMAEEHCHGQALEALTQMQQGQGTDIEIYCVTGDKIMRVTVSAQTDKITATDEVNQLGGQPHSRSGMRSTARHPQMKRQGKKNP